MYMLSVIANKIVEIISPITRAKVNGYVWNLRIDFAIDIEANKAKTLPTTYSPLTSDESKYICKNDDVA